MNKKYIIILSFIIFLLGTSVVSAGFLDDFFGNGDNQDTNKKFEDIGTSKNYSKDWYDISLNVSRDAVGTTLINTYTVDNTAYHFANMPGTSSKSFDDVMDWETPFTVEFDVVSSNDTSNFIQIYDGSHEVRKAFSQLKIVEGSHVKITSDNSSVVFNIDDNGAIKENVTLSAKSRIGLCLVKDGSLKYKNFVIY